MNKQENNKQQKQVKAIACVLSHTGACPPMALVPSVMFDPFENDETTEQDFDARWNQLQERGYLMCTAGHTSWSKTSAHIMSLEYDQAEPLKTLELWGAIVQADIADTDQSTSDDEFFDCMPDRVDQMLDFARALGLEDRAKEIVQEAVDKMQTLPDLIEQALGMRPRA